MPTPDLGAVSVAQLKQELGIASTDTAKDTVLPELRLARLFRPFVEDELPGLLA